MNFITTKVVAISGLIMFFLYTKSTFAQEVKDVTLTEIGQGKTKEDAKDDALRNAIEKAFGAFISSKTEILNDAIKDEILSITNGNIKSFEMLSETQMPDGSFTDVVKATVSVSKLTTFCENKGITVEFKGALFAANIKIQEMNKKNEESVINNLCFVVGKIADKGYDYSIIASEPSDIGNNNWKIPVAVHAKMNKNMATIEKIILNTINGISLTQSDIESYQKQNTRAYTIQINAKKYYLRGESSVVNLIELFGKVIPLKSKKFNISNGINNLSGTDVINCIHLNYHVSSETHYNTCSYWGGITSNYALLVIRGPSQNGYYISQIVMGEKPAAGDIIDAILFKNSGYVVRPQSETIFDFSQINNTEFVYNVDNHLSTTDLSKVTKYEVQPIK